MRKSFTINCNRTKEDFKGYKELIENNIYQGVEIFFPYNVNEEQRDLYTDKLNELRQLFPKLEFVMHLPHGPKNSLTSQNEEVVERMIDAIRYSANYGIKKLTLHLGFVDKNIEREKYLENNSWLIKNLVMIVNEAKKYEMNVMIENMPSDVEFGFSPQEILDLITIIDNKTNSNNMKFIIDTGHANVSKYSLKDYISLLGKYLYHIHYNDNCGSSDEHKRMGLGNVDFYEFMELLKEINYRELHCMEVIFKDYKELISFASDLDKYNKVDL